MLAIAGGIGYSGARGVSGTDMIVGRCAERGQPHTQALTRCPAA